MDVLRVLLGGRLFAGMLLGLTVSIVVAGVVIISILDSLRAIHPIFGFITLLICAAFIVRYWGDSESYVPGKRYYGEFRYYLLAGFIPWALGFLILSSLAVIGNWIWVQWANSIIF